jgi:hypothetical protein
MLYLLTRSIDRFPNDELLLQNNVWYNLWQIRAAPFIPVNIDAELIIEAKENSFYKANFKTLIKHEFNCRDNILNILRTFGYSAYMGDPYWTEKLYIESGFLLAYKFKNIKKINNAPNIANSTSYGNGWTLLSNNGNHL